MLSIYGVSGNLLDMFYVPSILNFITKSVGEVKMIDQDHITGKRMWWVE